MDKLTRTDLQARLEQYQAEKNFSDHHINILPDELIGIIETALALMDDHEALRAAVEVLAKRDGWRRITHPEGQPERVLIELLDRKP